LIYAENDIIKSYNVSAMIACRNVGIYNKLSSRKCIQREI